ncbi:MAG: hypothetical protein AB8E15_03660 [Bdellovibrionales bacterium]
MKSLLVVLGIIFNLQTQLLAYERTSMLFTGAIFIDEMQSIREIVVKSTACNLKVSYDPGLEVCFTGHPATYSVELVCDHSDSYAYQIEDPDYFHCPPIAGLAREKIESYRQSLGVKAIKKWESLEEASRKHNSRKEDLIKTEIGSLLSTAGFTRDYTWNYPGVLFYSKASKFNISKEAID